MISCRREWTINEPHCISICTTNPGYTLQYSWVEYHQSYNIIPITTRKLQGYWTGTTLMQWLYFFNWASCGSHVKSMAKFICNYFAIFIGLCSMYLGRYPFSMVLGTTHTGLHWHPQPQKSCTSVIPWMTITQVPCCPSKIVYNYSALFHAHLKINVRLQIPAFGSHLSMALITYTFCLRVTLTEKFQPTFIYSEFDSVNNTYVNHQIFAVTTYVTRIKSLTKMYGKQSPS